MRAATARTPHLLELGGFLRRRRSEIVPERVGVPLDTHQRRVNGLRREEVAQLAHISLDYYKRIEQGRLAPTGPVLDDLANALTLNGDERDYMRSLLEHARDDQRHPVEPASAQLRSMLEQMSSTPALIFGPRTEILAWNPLAARLYVDFGALAPEERNYTRLTFLHPQMRARFEDWEAVARSCIALLRRESAINPGDPALLALIDELTTRDESFALWWDARLVERQDSGHKALVHPDAGRVEVAWNIFRSASAPEQQLIVYSAEHGSESESRLARLRD